MLTCFADIDAYLYVGKVNPVLSDHIKQDIFSNFQIGGWFLLHDSGTESSGAFCAILIKQ